MKLRTEEYQQRLEDAGAQWSPDHATPSSFGSIDHEWRTVRQGGIGLADRSDRETLVITGLEAVPWLQGLVTNDLFTLAEPGSGLRTHAVNQIGRAIADARVLHIPDMLILDLEPGTLDSGFLVHLQRHIIMEDVTLRDQTEQTGHLGLYGIDAASLLAEVGSFAHNPETLEPLQGTWGELFGIDAVIQSVEMVGEPGFEIMIARQDMAHVYHRLLTAWPAVRPVGALAVEELRMEAGVPKFFADYDTNIIPIEADLNDTINYEKGCYLGQEIIHRLDTQGRPAKFLRVLVPEHEGIFEPKMQLKHGGKRVGVVRDVFFSRSLGRTLLTAYVKRGAYETGTEVTIEGADGALAARVEALGYPLASQA